MVMNVAFVVQAFLRLRGSSVKKDLINVKAVRRVSNSVLTSLNTGESILERNPTNAKNVGRASVRVLP